MDHLAVLASKTISFSQFLQSLYRCGRDITRSHMITHGNVHCFYNGLFYNRSYKLIYYHADIHVHRCMVTSLFLPMNNELYTCMYAMSKLNTVKPWELPGFTEAVNLL